MKGVHIRCDSAREEYYCTREDTGFKELYDKCPRTLAYKIVEVICSV